MQLFRGFVGLFFALLCALAVAQVPPTIPPIRLPSSVPVKPIPGVAGALEARKPFIARYAYCNAMQLYQSRRAAWEPIYRDAGASSADLDAYSGNLVTYIKEFCSDGRPPQYWREALARVEAFDSRVDAAMARDLGISLQQATQLRLSRLIAQLDKWREMAGGCLGGPQAAVAADHVSVFGSLLPATLPPPGLALDRRTPTRLEGKCSMGGGSTGTGVDRNTLGQCISEALSQAGSSCVNPAGEGPVGEPIATHGFGGRCADVAGASTCTERTRYVYGNGALSDVEKTTTRLRGRDGTTHTIETTHRSVIGSQREVISEYTRTTVDGRSVAARGTGDEAVDIAASGDEASAPPAEIPAGYRSVVRTVALGVRVMDVQPTGFSTAPPPVTGRGTYGSIVAGAFAGLVARWSAPGRGRDCASVNPQGSGPLGLALVISSDGGSPVQAGRLNAWDMVGQCVCSSLGRLGPGLAANSGFRCAPDENTRRLDCLLNPSGPADGIRPECVRYLQEDNPGRDTRTTLNEWCGRVAQCPPGAALASVSASGGAVCSCSTGLTSPTGRGGGTPGGGTCSRVTCAHGPGSMGSDLYRQCCGVPGESPGMGDPSAGPPVPRPRGPPEMPKLPLPR